MEKTNIANIVCITGLDIIKVKNIDMLNEEFFGKNFNNLTEEEKSLERLNKIRNISVIENIEIITKEKFTEELIKVKEYIKYIIVDDEILYYLTLAKNNIIKIYEKVIDEGNIEYVDILLNYDEELIRYLKN